MKILTVDDSSIVRKIVSSVILAEGYDVLTAADGLEALAALRVCPKEVALVILDWNLPVMDGLTCLRRIRAHKDLKRIPVLMLTAETEQQRMYTAIRHGAQHYMVKPFTKPDLACRIRQCLEEVDSR